MKQILLTALLLLATLTATAQKTAADAFTTAPTGIFPLLDKNTRLDMVDYYNSDLATPSANRLQGRSAITSLTPATITVKITDSSSAQIALLPAGRDTIIAVISTVATPGLDSTIKFYDSNWAPLPTDRHFTAPGWNDWLTPGHDITEITAHTPFMLASYFIDTDAGTLTATNNLATFLDEDTYKALATALRPTLTYKWNGKRFTK
ncbi:DUF3256 family protein [Muribaculaceae bacterium Isolate-110 (HZI)]|nr:DUF3256 family protein [Muribaculaceae bacterium Isolate-110 (HZI)]